MKNPNEKKESIHKTYRNKFNRVKRVAKRKYYNKEFNEHKGKLRNRRAFCMRMRQYGCLLYTSPSPRDRTRSRMPSSA